jgi:anti-anti-sigma factor
MQPLAIEGEMTIYRAAELKPLVVSAVESGAPAIDLAGVTEIDGAGVQLLLLARRMANDAARDLEIAAPSAAVREAAGLLGLHNLFGWDARESAAAR